METDIPKQYIRVGGKPVISYCIEALSGHEKIDALQIVADPLWQGVIEELLKSADSRGKLQGFSMPGENRQLSILHGLEDIRAYAKDGDSVLVHDAARPLLSQKQISDCINGIQGHDGAMPVLPMKDTVYASRDGKRVERLLNRSHIYAGQAPEIFRLGAYYEANCRLLPGEILQINGSTEPAILAGLDIAMIPGEEGNFKITTKSDLERFREILEKGEQALRRESKS